jgi:DNA-binding HxlR family transcriptional regulator
MKKQTNGRVSLDCASTRAKQQLQRALRLLSGKWKGEILWQLVEGKQRFGQLRRAIPDVTQHMLTTQLRDLENEGLVKRTVFAEVPPRVEYEMTPAARALKPVFDELFRWANAHGRLEPDPPPADNASDRRRTSARSHPSRPAR